MHRTSKEKWGVNLLTFANGEPVLEFVDRDGYLLEAITLRNALPRYERRQGDHCIFVGDRVRTFTSREDADAFAQWILRQRASL